MLLIKKRKDIERGHMGFLISCPLKIFANPSVGRNALNSFMYPPYFNFMNTYPQRKKMKSNFQTECNLIGWIQIRYVLFSYSALKIQYICRIVRYRRRYAISIHNITGVDIGKVLDLRLIECLLGSQSNKTWPIYCFWTENFN